MVIRGLKRGILFIPSSFLGIFIFPFCFMFANSFEEKTDKIYLKNNDFLTFYREFPSNVKRDKILIIHHGMGEHSGRYKILYPYFENSPIKIYAFDIRGNGRSGGTRAYVKKFSDYINDLEKFVDFVKEKEKVDKVYLLGHSMGTLVVTQFMKKKENAEEINGFLLSGFAGKVIDDSIMFTIQKMVAPILSTFFPKMKIETSTDLSVLTHDKEIIQKYENDPLRNKFVTARLGYQILKTTGVVFDEVKLIQNPVYIFHGKQDKVVSYKGSEELYEKIGSLNKELEIYENLRHETINELPKDRKIVINNFKNWIIKN